MMETVKERLVLADVRDMYRIADIKETSLTSNTIQALYLTSPEDMGRTVKLLELDDHLLSSINEGDTVAFKGRPDDSVVICTKTKTYEVKQAETSNSILISPDLKLATEACKGEPLGELRLEECHIEGVFQKYMQISECKPQWVMLLQMLEPSSFKGIEYEANVEQETLYDWDRLIKDMRASEKELIQAFTDYSIVNIDGYYRLISFEAEARSMTLMLGLFEENSWEIDEVDKEATYEELMELILKPVFDCLFEKYTEVSNKKKNNGSTLYRYNEGKACKILAKVLLSASPLVEYNAFMESWRIATPEKFEPKEEYLRGIALINTHPRMKTKDVVSCFEEDLSANLDERFKQLFRKKARWTTEEITPYLINMTTKTMDVNSLLVRNARCLTENGVRFYCSRYGV